MTEIVKPTHVTAARNETPIITEFSEIPIIDIDPLYCNDTQAKIKMAGQLRSACMDVGFFYIKNHGIPKSHMLDIRKQTEEFFHLPEKVKYKYDINKIKRHRGFVPVGALTAGPDEEPDQQEGYEIAIELPDDDPDYLLGSKLFGPNVWPTELPDFKVEVYTYFESVFQLGCKLFSAFALALNLPTDYFANEITKPIAQLRLLYYPPNQRKNLDTQMGIGAHTDYECFTILWQTEPGLQVQNRKNEWVEATPIDGTFLVNIGDMMMRWTNNLFRSTPHRVVTRTPNERYSFPFFFAANYETIVRCLETCTDKHHPPLYPPTKFGYWVENMHAYSYVYRHDERGKLPNPELES